MIEEKTHLLAAGDQDNRQTRCPRLGGPVTFQYCRIHAGSRLPCWKIFDCWWETFDVARFLAQTLPEGDFKALREAKPKPKILSLVELIQQAQKNVAQEKKEKIQGEEP